MTQTEGGAPGLSWRETLRVSCGATALCFALVLLANTLAAHIPPAYLGNWPDHIVRNQTDFIDRFFPFDARWYERIAAHGYEWTPSQPGVKQDVAFFPLWPLIMRLASLGAPARGPTVICAALFAFASVCAFHRLAARLLPERGAHTATCLYALYPAAGFLWLAYPTGLMNLLCILAILALMEGRLWRAAFCGGLACATGPLGLGTGLTVCLAAADATRRSMHPPWRRLGTLGALSLLALSGLLGFVLWQAATVGDPFAFITVQGAWAPPVPWLKRVPRALAQLLILPDFLAAARALLHALQATTLVAAQAALEQAMNFAGLGVALAALIGSARLHCRPLVIQGALTMALFLWFHGAVRPGNSTLRLIYCTIGCFPGLAWWLRGRPRLAATVLGVSAALLAWNAVVVAAGYHVV